MCSGRESGGSGQRWSPENKREEGYQEELHLPRQQWKNWDPGSLSTKPFQTSVLFLLCNNPKLFVVFVFLPPSCQMSREGSAFLYRFVVRKPNRAWPINILRINEFHTKETLLHSSIWHVQLLV